MESPNWTSINLTTIQAKGSTYTHRNSKSSFKNSPYTTLKYKNRKKKGYVKNSIISDNVQLS